MQQAVALHKRVQNDMIKSPGYDATKLDRLTLKSKDLVSCVDDLIATLYTTNGDEDELEKLRAVISRLESIT